MSDNKWSSILESEQRKERQYSSNIRDEFVNLYNDIVKVISRDGEERTDGECVDDIYSVLEKNKDIDEWQDDF